MIYIFLSYLGNLSFIFKMIQKIKITIESKVTSPRGNKQNLLEFAKVQFQSLSLLPLQNRSMDAKEKICYYFL